MRRKSFYRQVTWVMLLVFLCTAVSFPGAGLVGSAAAEELPAVPDGDSSGSGGDEVMGVGESVYSGVYSGSDSAGGTSGGTSQEETGGGSDGASGGDNSPLPPLGGTFDSGTQDEGTSGGESTGGAGGPSGDQQDGGDNSQPPASPPTGTPAVVAFVYGSDTWEAGRQGGSYTVYLMVYSGGSYVKADASGTVELSLVGPGAAASVAYSVYQSYDSASSTDGSLIFNLQPDPALAAGQYALQVKLNEQLLPAVWHEGGPAVIEVKGEQAELPAATVSGGVYWHAGQDKAYYTVWFSFPVTGEAYLALKDSEGELLAASPRQQIDRQIDRQIDGQIDGQSNFSAYLCSLGAPLPAGEYPLQVILDNQPLQEVRWAAGWNETGPPAVITVTDGILVDYLNSSWVLGRSPAPGDKKVYLEVWAYGVSSAEELTLSVKAQESGNEVDITSSCRGWLQGREVGGRVKLLYEVGLSEALAAGCSYRVAVGKGSTSREVVLSSGVQTSLLFDSNPSIYRVEAADPAVGKLTLKTVNVPAGTYRVVLKKWEQTGSSPWDGAYETVAAREGVSYDGSGILEVQFTAADGKPIYLSSGGYQVEISGGSITASGSTAVGYSEDYHYGDERCSAAAVLWVKPVDILALSSSPQQVFVEALLANIDPGQPDGTGRPSVALVKVDSSGAETIVAAVYGQGVSLAEAYHPRGYRYDNLYKLTGSLTLPANLPPAYESDNYKLEYRWRITCLNRLKEERSFLYSEPVTTRLGPAVKKVSVVNGLAPHYGGHQYGEPGVGEGSSAAYTVSSSAAELEFLLEDLFMVSDLDGLGAVLKGPGTQSSQVGTLVPDSLSWADAARTKITGKVNITGTLGDGQTYTLAVTYSGPNYLGEIGRAAVTASSLRGAMSLSLYEGEAPGLFAAGNNFQVKLLGTLNLAPENVKVHLAPLGSSEEVPLEVTPEKQGSDIALNCTAQQALAGVYELRLGYSEGSAESPLQQIQLMWGGMIDTFDFTPQVVCFSSQAFVSDVAEAGEGFNLKGGNFDTNKTYTAVLYRESDLGSGSPQWRWEDISVAVGDPSTLVLSRAACDRLPRGDYAVYVLEDGVVLPVTLELSLLLSEGEKPVVPPAVSINGGARYTTSPAVTVSINPGSYTQYRMAESESALAAAAYQAPPASGTLEYTFSDASYGTKRLYFQFKDEEGRETAVITAGIDYVAAATSQPAAYGAGNHELPLAQGVALGLAEGDRVTFWLKTDLGSAAAGVSFYKGDGSTSHAVTLLRGARDEAGVYTYSRTVSIDKETYQGVTGLCFYLRDTAAQGAWQSDIQSVNFVEATRINAVRSEFKKTYFWFTDEFYALPGSEVSLYLEGTPGRTAAAVIKYKDTGGNDKQSSECTLSETGGSAGIYTGTASLPGDAAEITGVIYRLAGAYSAEYEEEMLLKVAGMLKFTLANEDGAFNGLSLRVAVSDQLWKALYRRVENNQTTVDFGAVAPGSYSYSLYDSRRTYGQGELTVGAGEAKAVDLAAVGKPAVLTLDAGDESVEGYISYAFSGTASGPAGWAPLAKGRATVSGLQVGDQLDCRVSLDWNSLAVYEQPDTGFTVNMSKPAETAAISLEKLQTVKLSGRVVDKALSGSGDKVPLPGAVVTFEQWVQNGGRTIHNNASATTGEDGTFAVDAYAGTSGTLVIQRANYNTLRQESIGVSAGGQNLGDFELECRDKNFVNVSMLLAPAVREGETPEYLPAAGRISHITAEKADGTQVKGYYSSWNGRFTLEEDQDLQPGDVITLRAHYGYYARPDFELENEGVVEVALSRHLTGEAVFKGRSLGYITARPVSEGDTDDTKVPCYLLVFSADGSSRHGMVSGTGTLSTSSMGLAQGSYTAVFLSGEDLTRASRINSLKALDDLGLSPGVHYVVQNISLEYGKITDLGQFTVPTVTDEDLGYLALQGTSVTAKQLEVKEDGTIRAAVTVRYQLPERVAAGGIAVSNVSVNLDGGKVEGSEFWFNGNKYYAWSDTSIYRATGQESEQRQGIITFTTEITEVTTLKVTAWVALSRAEPYMYAVEYIGAEEFPFSAVTIVSPEEVPAWFDGHIEVQGVAPRDAEVEIRDNGLTVGKAKANERGSWQAKVSLVDPKQPGIHVMQAVTWIDKGAEKEQMVSAPSYTRVLGASAPAVEDITLCQPYDLQNPWSSRWGYRFKVTLKGVEDLKRQVLVINPYYSVFGRFKLVRGGEGGQVDGVGPAEVDYAAFVNDYRGVTTLFPAAYNSESGYWEAEMKLPQPGEISVVYSMKIPEEALTGDPEKLAQVDVSYMTGSVPIDVSQLPDKPQVDPASIPEEIRSAQAEITSSGENNPDQISATLTIQGAQGGTATLSFSGTHERVTVNLDDLKAQGYVRIDTAQGYYYTKAPEISFGSVSMKKTVYFSPELYGALGGSSGGALAQSLPEGTSTTQAILDKADYACYLSGEVDLIVSTSQNPNALGSLGTGMTVVGGAVLAGQVVLGRVGKDPAGLRDLAQQVKDDGARTRLMQEIDEYADATRKSKYVNVLMGGVSYGASFFGPVGKGLSFVVSTGGQVFGKAIGDEYDLWYDSILRMILVELEKQNKRDDKDKNKGGKKKKVNDPVWKIDPSGYVFEATESQRVMGVKATAMVKEGSIFREWTEAEEYGEVNPQFTDAEGKYGWDVPEGTWKVSFEAEGYLPCETKEIEVPPAHDQVNIGLLATAGPQVKSVEIYPEGAEVEFDRYMLPNSLAGNIAIFDADGYSVPVKEITVLKWVYNTGYTADNPYSNNVIDADRFALRVRAVPDMPGGSLPVYGEDGSQLTYKVKVSGSAASYAGVPMGKDYEATLEAAPRYYVKAVEELAPLSVPKGTAFASLGLPADVTVTLEDDSTENVAVEWAEGSYDRLNLGTYTLEGTLMLPAGVANPSGLKAQIQVTVTVPSEEPRLTRLELSGSLPDSFTAGSTFDLSSLTLKGYDQNGEEYSLSGLDVTWESSDSGVAAVTGSTLTAVSAGFTTVKARVGSVESNSITVTVTAAVTPPPAEDKVTGVSLNKTELTLTVGQSETLIATVSPADATNRAVSWSSDNTAVATVDDGGKVTALSAGTAVITVTTVDGGRTATCTVNVRAVSTGGGGGGAAPPAPTAAAAVTLSRSAAQTQIAAGAWAVTVEVPAAAAVQSAAVEREALQDITRAGVPLVIKAQAAEIQFPPAALVLPQGAERLMVRAQALAQAEAAQVLPPAGAALKPASSVVELSVEAVRGQSREAITSFVQPVKVRLPYNPAGANEDFLGAYRYNETEKTWEYVRSKVNREARAVEFSAAHFSKYAAMEHRKTFDDIQGHWAQADVELMASRWVVKGVDEKHFRPEDSVTRAEFTALLVRALGIEAEPGAAPAFADVAPGQWYYGEVAAAHRAGLVQGVGEGRFAPGEQLTREQMITLMVRALKRAGTLEEPSPDRVAAALEVYTDAPDISTWARVAVAAAVETGLVKGRTASTLEPKATCTRAEGAVLIKRLLSKIE